MRAFRPKHRTKDTIHFLGGNRANKNRGDVSSRWRSCAAQGSARAKRDVDLQELYRAELPSVDKDPLAVLPKSLYRFVWRVSGPQHVRLCLLTLLLFPLSIIDNSERHMRMPVCASHREG